MAIFHTSAFLHKIWDAIEIMNILHKIILVVLSKLPKKSMKITGKRYNKASCFNTNVCNPLVDVLYWPMKTYKEYICKQN
jgi:hypothetical protein